MSTKPSTPLGPEPTCAGPDPHPNPSKLKLPARACDSHFHIFGPGKVFPYAPERTFTPPDAPKAALVKLHQLFGFERGVFVQSACHGCDHAAVLDALGALNGRYRGVALLEPTTSAAEIKRLDAAGFCGVRFHLVSHLAAHPEDEMRAIMKLVAPYGWHIAVHTMHNGLAEHFDFIKTIEAPVVIDHIGRFDIEDGEASLGYQALRRLLDTGNVWVKLSGTDRISKQPPYYPDIVPLARKLAEQAPERILWGSDWPHPNHKQTPNDGTLVDLIAEIAPDENTRHRMLVDNPEKLFRFG